jgi:RNA polymerase sigma-70 factor, ECF subfamily
MTIGPGFNATLAEAQQGDEQALTALYRDLQPGLLRYLSAQEPAEGEDLASEVWLDVGRALRRFEGDESAFRCWLFTIARRRLVDLRRTRSRRRTQPMPPQALASGVDPVDPFRPVDDQALALLAQLPGEQAEIVLLRVVAGLDSDEVALVTGKKPGTVRVIQKRALERLAELVEREASWVVTR